MLGRDELDDEDGDRGDELLCCLCRDLFPHRRQMVCVLVCRLPKDEVPLVCNAVSSSSSRPAHRPTLPLWSTTFAPSHICPPSYNPRRAFLSSLPAPRTHLTHVSLTTTCPELRVACGRQTSMLSDRYRQGHPQAMDDNTADNFNHRWCSKKCNFFASSSQN